MDSPRLLANDTDDDGELIVDDIRRLDLENEETSISQILGPLLSKTGIEAYSSNQILKGSLTLRECNAEYGRSKGCKYNRHQLPEFDRCTTKGCISPLRRFQNSIGHFIQRPTRQEYMESASICFEPEILPNIGEFIESLNIHLGPSVQSKHLVWPNNHLLMNKSLPLS